ncbi:hypothetical protein [Dactylosporangium sp. NPDC051541]|uniref:hypothetical protein n=1 Tax=Dactylosporangium sp. NPDC051541 TaxID=3363977 RepID=UPI0037BA4824
MTTTVDNAKSPHLNWRVLRVVGPAGVPAEPGDTGPLAYTDTGIVGVLAEPPGLVWSAGRWTW